jgi:hypothetical protein
MQSIIPNTSFSVWIPVIAAIGGGFVSGIILLINNWINKKSEERKHIRQIMLNAALDHWKQTCNFALERSKMTPGQRILILPFEANIVYVTNLANVLFNEKITKENIVSKLKKVREISDEVTKFLESEEKIKTSKIN